MLSMMSQQELSLDSTYIVSSNGDYQGNKIVVNVLESPAVTSMNSVHAQQGHVVPLQVVSNQNMTHQYLNTGSTNLPTIQHLQTAEQQMGQGEQTTVEDQGTVIEVTPMMVEAEQKSNSSTEEESVSKSTGISWPKKAVLKLISLHKEHQHLFDDTHYKKKSIWEMIARKMKEAGMAYTWSQVENKWKSLTKRYRDTVDYNARNNTGLTHTCPFYDELSEAYSYVPTHVGVTALSLLTPLGITQTSANTPVKRHVEFHGTLSEADLASLTKKKKYMNQNAVTNSSSAQTVSGATSSVTSSPTSTAALQPVDLAVVLRSIHEDRKRQDKLKMDRLEKMHKEKMDMFKQFLDIVKDLKSTE